MNNNRTVTVNASTMTVGGAIGDSGSGFGLTKAGVGTLNISGANTYSGATVVSAGILTLGNSLALQNSTLDTSSSVIGDSTNGIRAATGVTTLTLGGHSGATGAVSVSGKLTGSGPLGGATTLNSGGIHNAGDPSVAGGVGSQTFSSTLEYAGGSIFEWDIKSSKNADGVDGDDGVAGTDFDSVAGAGTKTASDGSIFKVVLGGDALTDIQNGSNTFWNTPFATQTWNMSAIFSNFSGAFTQVQTSANVSAQGSFTITGSSLTWTAVPEPTSALAGLLVAAGCLRRRRN